MIIWFYGFACLLYLSLLGWAWLQPERSKAVFYYIILLLGLFSWTATLYVYYYVDVGEQLLFYGRLNYSVAILIPLGLAGFFYTFPSFKHRLLTALAEKIIWAAAIVLAFLTQFTGLIIENETMTAHGPEVTLGAVYMLYLVHVFGYLGSCFVLSVFKLRRHKGIERLKFKYLFWAFVPTILLLAVSNAVLPVYGVLAHLEYTFLITVPIAVASFYAISKYRFLNLRWAAQELLVRLSNAGIYLLLVLGLLKVYNDGLLSYQVVGVLVLLVLMLAVYWWERTFGVFEQFWNYAFFHQRLSPVQRIHSSLESFRQSVQAGTNELSAVLGVEKTQFVYADSAPAGLKDLVAFYHDKDYQDEIIADELPYMRSQLTTQDITRLENDLKKYMLSAVVPVRGPNKKLLGLLLLERKLNGQLFSFQEISELKRTLSQANIYISREREYQQVLDRLQDSSALEKEFIDDLMHEIRHPLMIARNVTEVIDWAQLRPEDQAFLKQSETSLQDLSTKLERITEAFTWSRDTATVQKTIGSLEQLREFIREDMVKENHDWLEIMDFKWETSELESSLFYFDMAQMKRVFVELGKNATFFKGPDKLKMTVRAFAEGDDIVVHYTDNGIGIEKRYWEKIFDLMFVVSPSRNQTEAGLGIGLTIVRGILRAHGGDIKVLKSERGKGTTFELRAPLQRYEG